jgi:RNA polymerase sigma-70 factor (ECF subfamily)
MPPFRWWLRGRADIGAAMSAPGSSCEGARLVPAEVNGSPAFWQLRDGTPFALVTLDLHGGRIAGLTTFLDPGSWPAYHQ